MRLTTLGLKSDEDIPHVRHVGRVITEKLGFTTFQQTRIVTAIIEVARNAIVHGGGGRTTFSLQAHDGALMLEVNVVDGGAGMEPAGHSERRSPSTRQSTGLGLGLKGAERIADTFALETGCRGTDIRLGFLTSRSADSLNEAATGLADRLSQLREVNPAAALAQQNHDLMRAIAERDLLIQEVHHRTRNNIALIRSLVRLSEHSAKNEETKEALADLGARMQAILSVHEQLERASDAERLPLLPFLSRVADRTRDAFNSLDQSVTISVEGGNLTIESTEAVDYGLIVVELLTNALKYAFTDRPGGTIKVRILPEVAAEPNGSFVLEVADDGRGLPAGMDEPHRSQSLGWRMIRAMAARHGGRIEVVNGEGLLVRIRFEREVATTAD